MKKINLLMLLILMSVVGSAQIVPTSYQGAFAPAPTPMWTDSWTNFDPQNAVYPTPTVTVNAAITTNTTWTSGNTYLLSGLIYVKNNATLTIQPGTRILGDNSGSALVITRGAKLMAVGTAAAPIVFSSDKPVGQRAKGDWGGVILLGKSTFNINGGENYIEGIANSDDTKYGGGASPILNDNSGTLKYVRIEFGGYVFAPNNEINGLTMGAVGSGTTIDYVQVSFTNDDAFEWFGGTVDCKHLVAYRNLDDDFDTDNGYSGRVQFGLAVRDPQISDAPSVSTSEGFESDNNATGSEVSPYTSAIFTNMTMIGPAYRQTLPNGGVLASGYKRAARIRRASRLKIYNSIFMDYPEGLHIDGNGSETAALNGTLRWNNNILAGITNTSKVLQVNTSGNNPSFNIATWYAANGNTTLTTSAGLLTTPYNTSNATVYTGLDYRPASQSVITGASFTDSYFNGILNAIATTKLKSTLCGVTIAALNTQLYATTVTGAEAYRFQVTNGATVREYTPAAGVNAFNLTLLDGGAAYGVSYSVKVAIKVEGVWGNYGDACIVTTPAASPLTKLKTAVCGVTIPTLGTQLSANTVIGVSGYRFEITNGASVQTFVPAAGSNIFTLTELPNGASFSTTYSIRVATLVNGVWGAYGDACTVTTPSAATKVTATQCGVTIPALNTPIYADEVTGATEYRFEVTQAGNVRIKDNPVRYFNLTQLTGGAAYGATYSIRVAAKLNGVFQAYGAACNVTTTTNIPPTKLKVASCGVTLPTLGTAINATPVPSVEGYKFEVTNGGNVRTLETVDATFNLTQLSGGATYATTYSIRVAVRFNGTYGPYGDACTVTTPATAPTTSLQATACGSTLAALNSVLYANSLAGAQMYRFEVTNGALVRTVDKTSYYFKLTELSGEAITYGTTYSVRVAVMTNSVWGVYGSSCNVTTPAVAPLTTLKSNQCGVTLAALNTLIYANAVLNVDMYRYEVTNGATVRTIDKPAASYYFRLTDLGGEAITPNTVYSVRVATSVNGAFGAYGSACTVTTPNSARMETVEGEEEIVRVEPTLVAYPNPFQASYQLTFDSNSNEPIDIVIFDMTGNPVEKVHTTKERIGELRLGDRYRTGIYNGILTQGDVVKRFRLIKQ